MRFTSPGELPLKPMPKQTSGVRGRSSCSSFAVADTHPEGRRCVLCECKLSVHNPDTVCAPCVKKLPRELRP